MMRLGDPVREVSVFGGGQSGGEYVGTGMRNP